jgi:hypothetical protein
LSEFVTYSLIDHGLQALDAKRHAFHYRSINANDFDVLAHPIQGQVDSAAVSGLFDFLFDHLFPEDPELGHRGFAGIFRLPADLFQARFCLQGDHILIYLVDIDFLSTRIFRDSRLAPAEFPVT